MCLIFTTASLACSIRHPDLSIFPSDIYIFTGRVIGFAEKVSANGFLNDANGLKIKVIDSVNLPKKSNDYYEVFPFGLAPDCTDLGLYEDELEKYYPIGSEVVLIAIEAEMIPGKNKTGQIRLEVPDSKSLNIFRFDSKDKMSPDIRTIYNYSNWYSDLEKKEVPWLDFELLKDLKRIEDSKTEAGKIEIFERLAFFPERWFDFENAVQTYIKNSKNRKYLINKRNHR